MQQSISERERGQTLREKTPGRMDRGRQGRGRTKPKGNEEAKGIKE